MTEIHPKALVNAEFKRTGDALLAAKDAFVKASTKSIKAKRAYTAAVEEREAAYAAFTAAKEAHDKATATRREVTGTRLFIAY